MKKRKFLCAALAAVSVVGSISVVSFAETAEIREDSKYEITLDKEIVDGEEKAVVTFSGLPKEALTFDYKHRCEYYGGVGYIGVCDYDILHYIGIIIDNEDAHWGFMYDFDYNDDNREYKWSAGTIIINRGEGYNDHVNADPNSPAYPVVVEDEETTLTLKAYLDPNDEKIKSLESEEKITVRTYTYLYGRSGVYHDINGDGQITGDEYGTGVVFGEANEYVPIIPGEKIALEHNICENDDIPKERVKITNNLNAPETSEPVSEPAESTVIPGGSEKPAEQEKLEVTLKNVDSENGIEGAKLDELLFGESGWTWDQVEKVEFTSEKLFSVLYKDDSGNWVPLGETVSVRAASDDVWDTAWTLFSSAMGKTKYAKVIAKEGTTDVKATIYFKKGAEKPDNTDQKPTGITLAIAPAVLAAGAAVVLLKKRK